jgi:drug/metabolite transporter (DMT)-like permease
MNAQVASAAVVIASLAMYQIFIKTVPTALVCTLLAIKFAPIDAPHWSLSEFSWPAVAVGIAIVGIEIGYLFMYRSGWHLAAAPLIAVGGAAVVLIPVSVLVFRQPWSARYGFGILICLYGLYLLSPREQ